MDLAKFSEACSFFSICAALRLARFTADIYLTSKPIDTETYFTFDIDGIDPTFAPGTGTPEVGGINVREAQLVIRELRELNFIGADVVEVSPPFDINNMTSLVGATIAFEILCTMTKTN